MSGQENPAPTARGDDFSYRCNACCRCCYNKKIQLNPFESATLAGHLGLSTGDFLDRHCMEGGVYLAQKHDGSCGFLDAESGCAVHPARPLVCRVYPVGRQLTAEGRETILSHVPHPQTEGVYGRDGTVDDWFRQQGAEPYIREADAYYWLYVALVAKLQTAAESQDDAEAGGMTELSQRDWLDIDGLCDRLGIDGADADPATKARHHRRLIAELAGLDVGENG